jgi:ABC-2 type transport system ATP-binding protein
VNDGTSEKIIEIKGLSKQYKEVLAVNKLNVNVYKGDVFGFLGPNGAGKSTTIRMLLTLIFPTEGTINLFGKELQANRIEILRRIGAIVEKPDFYAYLTAYKNLEILGKVSGYDADKKRIMEVLELVGLAERAGSKVKTYSHGMKQRLGLAQALLHKPDLIILDEPTTGLDPQGMKDIRDLIIQLSENEKITIFLSSHILSEVEQVANRMIIINKGQTVVEGYVDDLLDASELRVSFDIDNTQLAKEIFLRRHSETDIVSQSNHKFITTIGKDDIAPLNRAFIEAGLNVSAVVPTRSLEEYFLNITLKDGK